jgi:hypothetical protein
VQASGNATAKSPTTGGADRRRSDPGQEDAHAAIAAALTITRASLVACKQERDALAAALAERRARCAGLGAALDSARAELAERQAEKDGLVAQLARLRREHAAALAGTGFGAAAGATGARRTKKGRTLKATAEDVAIAADVTADMTMSDMVAELEATAAASVAATEAAEAEAAAAAATEVKSTWVSLCSCI